MKHRSDVLRRHDTHTKFHKNCLRHSKVNTDDSQTNRQHGDLISLLFLNKGTWLKTKIYIHASSGIRIPDPSV
jgi:hypothetical protein